MNKQEILECIKHTLKEKGSQRRLVEESLIWREGLTIKEKIFPKDIMDEAIKYIKIYNLVLWRNSIYYYDSMKEFTLK